MRRYALSLPASQAAPAAHRLAESYSSIAHSFSWIAPSPLVSSSQSSTAAADEPSSAPALYIPVSREFRTIASIRIVVAALESDAACALPVDCQLLAIDIV